MDDEQEVRTEDTTSQTGAAASVSAQWRYRPVPDDPEKHDEFYQKSGLSPEGLRVIGARVRGKKHKHEGTNCDDWFEFGTTDSWTVIAVSDGAGSKVFSRVGAKAACATAVRHLCEELATHKLTEREHWQRDVFQRDKQSGVFVEEDIEYVQTALHEAMAQAYNAVEAKARSLAEGEQSEACSNILGRKVEIDDLSATLLLAVHTTVNDDGKEHSFVVTCQIGDGMLAVIDTGGRSQLLGVPDSGEFAGQTEFLTTKKKLEKGNLVGKTFPFFGPLRALMVMTDGVADDYFPNDPGMSHLYGDLVINGILGPQLSDTDSNPDSIAASLRETQLTDISAVKDSELAVPVETLTPNKKGNVLIRSIRTYAEKLGLATADVLKSPPLLIAGTAGAVMSEEEKPEEKLRVWLDSYHVRGSFDDRTLVVLYREVTL